MNIFIQTHNESIHLIEAFQALFNKYWGVAQSVTILGYAEPEFDLAPNFAFVSLGEDKGPKIGGQLIDFFSGIEDDHFVYSVYSQLIIRPVDLKLFEYLIYILENSDRVGRVALTGDLECNQPYSYAPLSAGPGFYLVEHSQTANYRISAIWSIWGRGYFLKHLKPNMDLWQWETTERAKNDGWQILSTVGKYAITCARVYKRGCLHAGSFRSWDKYGAEMAEEDQGLVRRVAHGPVWKGAGEYVDLMG